MTSREIFPATLDRDMVTRALVDGRDLGGNQLHSSLTYLAYSTGACPSSATVRMLDCGRTRVFC